MMVVLCTCLRIEWGSVLILSRRSRSYSLMTIRVLLLFAIQVLLPFRKLRRMRQERLNHIPQENRIPKTNITLAVP